MKDIFKGRWVFDTNLFIYFLDRFSPFHPSTKNLFAQIQKGDLIPFVAQQNMVECAEILIKFYKEKPAEAVKIIEEIVSGFGFNVINPLPASYLKFFTILKKASLRLGKIDIFDCYLAATMIDNRIYKILTLNVKDFSKIKEIEAVSPFESVYRDLTP